MTPALAGALVAVAVVSLVMVGVMVRFSREMLTPRTGAGPIEPRSSPSARWGAIYVAVWLALIGAFLWVFAASGEAVTTRHIVLLAGVAGAWFTFNGLFIAFARLLMRTEPGAVARAAAEEAALAAAGELEPQESEEQEAAPAAGPAVGELAAAEPVPEDTAWLLPALRAMWGLAWPTALALVVIAIGELLPPMRALARHLEAHRATYLTAAVVAAASGFALFMGCILHLLLGGVAMGREEIAALRRAARPGDPPIWLRSAGPGRGGRRAAGGETVTFPELRAAWRARAWRVSRRWRRVFLLLVGVTLMSAGIVGITVVLGPPGVKFLLLLVFGYAAIRIASGLWRAGAPPAPQGPGAIG